MARRKTGVLPDAPIVRRRTGVLPDLFIGAHAQVEKLPLLTRDTRRCRSYFPTVELITPSSEA